MLYEVITLILLYIKKIINTKIFFIIGIDMNINVIIITMCILLIPLQVLVLVLIFMAVLLGRLVGLVMLHRHHLIIDKDPL